ncbi:MAG: YoaK family protein [Sphingomonas sp.]
MTRLDPSDRVFAVGLAAMAGYVDAIGFLLTGGFFVSFMSGNTTRLGVGLGALSNEAGLAARLIVMFVGGVAVGSLIARQAGAVHRVVQLIVIAGMIGGAAVEGQAAPGLTIAFLAFAMGICNTVVGPGDARIGVTYMTGNLVRVGQAIAEAISGGSAWGWVPPALLWTGMMAGAWIGAIAYFRFGVMALWAASAAALVLAVAGARRGRAA